MSGVEIIIPSFGRPELLEAGILWLRQLYPAVKIRVALQGEDFRDRLGSVGGSAVFVDWRPAPDLIGAINDTVALSSAEICILLDDDARPLPGWLEGHLAALEASPTAGYSYGRVIEMRRWRSLGSELMRIGSELLFGWAVPLDGRQHGRIVGWITAAGLVFANYHLPGDCRINAPAEGNLAFRRKVFLDSGGFNSAFRGNCWGYGPEWGVRLARKGIFGRYAGNAVVMHLQATQGGTRAAPARWYWDFVANNKVVVASVGPMGWIGALPRLVRRYFVR